MQTTLIFDIDGTILNNEEAVLQSLQQILKEEGKEYPTDALRFVLGIPGIEALEKLEIDDVERVHLKWCEVELDYSKEVKVFPDLENVLLKIAERPIRTGIVTSKTRQELIDGFVPFGLNSIFEEIICATDTEHHKPHPEPLLTCLERLQVKQSEAIYIGDSIYDLQCAKSAGVKFALALWGSKTTKGYEEADFILTEPKDILDLIKN